MAEKSIAPSDVNDTARRNGRTSGANMRLAVGSRDATDMHVCGRCGRVCGPWRFLDGEHDGGTFVQTCQCEPRAPETWPRFDFNTSVELCWCCAAEALPTGSRWAQILCPVCKERALRLVRRDGRLPVPLGRHSLMNRISAPLDDVWSSPDRVPEFARRLSEMSAGIIAMWEWGGRQALANLRAVRGDRAGNVPLATYLAAVAALPVDKEAVFASMCREVGGAGPVG
jgi:hypothetical protein